MAKSRRKKIPGPGPSERPPCAWEISVRNGTLYLDRGPARPQAADQQAGARVPPVPPAPPILGALGLSCASKKLELQTGGDVGGVGGRAGAIGGSSALVDADKQLVFLEALSGCGSVPEAARVVGISPRSPHRWARDDEAFAELMTKARELGLRVRLDTLEHEADRRAVEGVEKPIYQGGRLVGTRRDFSDLMLIFRLKRLDPAYRDQVPRAPDTHNIQVAVIMADGRRIDIGRVKSSESIAVNSEGDTDD